ncbi:hypothetical protein VT06_14915 [Arsukibacterium sp. MJ3]|uniref:hypothetical protein n=1 Tax=Arsukibacterium sp. MJ3 TaxID=1632859 RepID=UPI0006273A54|nr:hypothetical protein [Arsukibacterium sp. MJ3]KKO47800.1 hypothetical protein VT06_14915 [Arsukibacterium sp. MJ3]
MLTARCIWQQAEHNAFTDLIWFQQALWCVFREGSAHVSPGGAFRLLRSADLGQSWHKAALISAGDCSYAGMVLHNNTLYISYYSSHAGKTAIYFIELAIAAAALN